MTYRKFAIKSQKDLLTIKNTKNFLYTKAKFGPSKITKIPLNLTPNIAFLVGAIIGDGHLRKSKAQITIELTNYDLLDKLQNICNTEFERNFNISKKIIRKNRKPTKYLILDSKAIYNLMNKLFEIPIGKKSNIVIVPHQINSASKKVKIAFLKGIMATEGGKRKRGFGLSSASKQLRDGICLLLKENGINTNIDQWTHKRYKKTYYGLVFSSDKLSLMGRCRSGQTGDV